MYAMESRNNEMIGLLGPHRLVNGKADLAIDTPDGCSPPFQWKLEKSNLEEDPQGPISDISCFWPMEGPQTHQLLLAVPEARWQLWHWLQRF